MKDPVNQQAQKHAMRKLARDRAAGFAPQTPAWSQQLCERLLTSEIYQNAQAIMGFLALPPPAAEADLAELIANGLAAGKRICLPRVDWQAGTMEPARIESLAGLVKTRHGLREPPPSPASETLLVEDLDLILVPGLAFDLAGGRLGRGAGYYDRFLLTCRPETVLCGVCFEAQLVDRIPTDSWDVPVNVMATERRLITLRP